QPDIRGTQMHVGDPGAGGIDHRKSDLFGDPGKQRIGRAGNGERLPLCYQRLQFCRAAHGWTRPCLCCVAAVLAGAAVTQPVRNVCRGALRAGCADGCDLALSAFACICYALSSGPDMTNESKTPPRFDAAFRERFAELLRWRRDVRRFRTELIDPGLIKKLLALASLAPSVGLSQPWRFVLVETEQRRQAIRDNFASANDAALNGYAGERQARYARLKLEGLSQAPVHLAVCA